MLLIRTVGPMLCLVAVAPFTADASGCNARRAEVTAANAYSTNTMTIETSVVAITVDHQEVPGTMAGGDRLEGDTTPAATGPPDMDDVGAWMELKERHMQTTYYTCRRKGTHSQCGGYRPFTDTGFSHGSSSRPSTLLGWSIATVAGLLVAVEW